MTMTFDNRKRQRNCDDSCEFMPISKRMNNLHIRSGQECISDQLPNQNSSSDNCARSPLQDSESAKQNGKAHNTVDANSGNEMTYNPDLDHMQNPYYYQINSVLFDAHVQRIQRHVPPD